MISRRDALVAVAGVTGFIHGRETPVAQSYDATMVLALDRVRYISVVYRGREARITPEELLLALSGKEESP